MPAEFPEPESGMVVRFRYRWADRSQPSKERPACIALVRRAGLRNPERVGRQDVGYLKEVVYLPLSTKPPREEQTGIELPSAITAMLKLGDQRSWVIVSECNVQYWPNDVGLVPGRDRQWFYGFVPPRFFGKIVRVFRDELRRRTGIIQNVHYLPGRRR